MYKLWNVVLNGRWVGLVVASSYDNATIDAAYRYGNDARPVLVRGQ